MTDPTFFVDFTGFGRGVPKSLALACTPLELMHSAITTGKGLRPFGGSTARTWQEVAWKVGAVEVGLSSSLGRWRDSPIAAALDPSEKVGLSYTIANLQTGIVARRHFGMTHVAHLALLDPRRYRKGTSGRVLPDFAAIDIRSRKSLVIEAKGSMGLVSGRTIDRARDQLDTRVSFIGYDGPTRYVHASDFPRPGWRARLIRVSGPSSPVRATPAALLVFYYAPIIEMVRALADLQRSQRVEAVIPNTGLLVSVDDYLAQAIESATASYRQLSARDRNVLLQGGKRSVTDEMSELVDRATSFAQEHQNDVDLATDRHSGADGVRVERSN